MSYDPMRVDPNTSLYEKMSEEQAKYRGWLLSQPPEEILHHTFEYSMRQDILMSLECRDLSDEQAKALLSSPSPLAELYSTYEDLETNHMDDIRDCIETHANGMIAAQREALRSAPVYIYPATHAREQGELEVYRTSHKANVACKEALEKAISGHYADNRIDTKAAFAEVSEQFGTERMKYILAVTVREKDWDGRISRDNKDWAKTVAVFENKDYWGNDRNYQYVVDQAHPGLVDLFVKYARKEFAREQETVEQKPSVLKKLKEPKPEVGSAPVPRKKDMER